MMEEDISVLLKRVKSGDKSATSILVSMYEKLVYRTCFRFFNNSDDALDASQEVFIKVFHYLSKFEGRSSFKTWIYKITVNTCLTISEKKKKEKQGILDYFAEWLASLSPKNVEDDYIEQQESEVNQKNLQEALAKIPEKYRIPLILKEMEGLSLEKISEICEIPVGTVKSRLNRGRSNLLEKLEFQMKAENYEKM